MRESLSNSSLFLEFITDHMPQKANHPNVNCGEDPIFQLAFDNIGLRHKRTAAILTMSFRLSVGDLRLSTYPNHSNSPAKTIVVCYDTCMNCVEKYQLLSRMGWIICDLVRMLMATSKEICGECRL